MGQNVTIDQIKFDRRNANKGTERGRYAIESSMREFGFADAGTLDRNNVIIGGNKRTEVAGEIGMDEAIIIDVDGTKPVFIRRNDLDMYSTDDDKARRLAYALNRSQQLSLEWDAEQVLADLNAGVDLSGLWRQDELDAMLKTMGDETWDDAFGRLPDEDRAPFQQMTFTLHDTQAATVKRAMAAALRLGDFADSPNQNSNGNALALICEVFVTEHGDG